MEQKREALQNDGEFVARDVCEEFKYHNVDEQQKADITAIRHMYSDLLDKVRKVSPAGRYTSIVATKLEEACFFTIKGISTRK